MVWTRLLVLFFGLVFIKAGLLAGFRKHLYEIHWRVGGFPDNGWNNVAYYAFAGLGFLSLLRLAFGCRAVGLKAVRSANAAVLVLGLLFILLTFHIGDKNYFYPIMTGILDWNSLIPYLSLNLFFEPPFLAAWILGYIFAYYFLARTGREGWTLHLTAICALAYVLVCFQDLVKFRDQLLVADALGLAGLLASLASPSRFRLGWLLAPLAWVTFFCILFGQVFAGMPGKDPYLFILAGETVVLFAAVTLWARRQGFFAVWSCVVLFFFAAFLLFTNANYPLADNYNNLFCLALEFPRYLVGELAVVGGITLVAGLYFRAWPEARVWWLDVLNFLVLSIALVDLRLSQIMGVRLGWDVLEFGNSPKMMWRMAKPYLPGALLGLAAVALLYGLVLWCLHKWLGRPGVMPVLHPCEEGMPPAGRVGPISRCRRPTLRLGRAGPSPRLSGLRLVFASSR